MFDSGALQARDHLRPQHRGDSRRDEQPDKDDRDPFYPPYRVRHTRNMRPIKKAAIRETIRIATSMTANIAARLPERQLSLRQSWPAFSGVRTPTSGNPFGPLRERKAHQGSAPLTTKSASRAPHCAQRSRLAQTITVVAAPCCSLSSAVSGSNRCRQVLHHTISRTLAVKAWPRANSGISLVFGRVSSSRYRRSHLPIVSTIATKITAAAAEINSIVSPSATSGMLGKVTPLRIIQSLRLSMPKVQV